VDVLIDNLNHRGRQFIGGDEVQVQIQNIGSYAPLWAAPEPYGLETTGPKVPGRGRQTGS
jgi:hypothetical protein